MAESLAGVLQLDGGIGMRSEIEDGVYTGRPDGPFTYREGKAEAIREMAGGEGIDLAESYAYSDSESDLPDAARGRATRWWSTPTASSSGSRARRAGRSCASTSWHGA